jgi:hypothetical protein
MSVIDEAERPVDDSLLSTLEMLWCAFDSGIGEDEYWPLIAVLREYLSFRAIARVITVMDTRYEYYTVFNDAMRFTAERVPDWTRVYRLRDRLMPCGYIDWANEGS